MNLVDRRSTPGLTKVMQIYDLTMRARRQAFAFLREDDTGWALADPPSQSTTSDRAPEP
jgi:hypothetical protein